MCDQLDERRASVWLTGPSRMPNVRGALIGSSERTHEVVAQAARPQAIQFDVLDASNATIAVDEKAMSDETSGPQEARRDQASGGPVVCGRE